jgi:hypothetical protein
MAPDLGGVTAASAVVPNLAPKVWQFFQRFMIDR